MTLQKYIQRKRLCRREFSSFTRDKPEFAQSWLTFFVQVTISILDIERQNP